MRNILAMTAAVAALWIGVPAHAFAQIAAPLPVGAADGERSVEYFVSRHRLAAEGNRVDLDGIGGRVMWSLAPLARSGGNPLLARSSVGGYLVHTPEDAGRVEMWHYGAQADVRITQAPLAGRIDPFVSLGVGALQWEAPGSKLPAPVQGEPASATETRTATSVAVTPGIGARVRLVPGVALRSDLRRVIGLDEGSQRSLELSGGISVSV